MKNIRLVDLIDTDVLQQIQDGFSRYTGMAALTTDSDGVPVTVGSGFTRFCMELTRKSSEGCRNCELCDKNGALLTLKNGHATVYDCHAGLVDFAAPIMVEGMFLGSFIGGQVRTEEVNEATMRKTAQKYGIDPDEYVCAAKATKCLKKEDAERAAEYLEEIASSLSKLAYSNYLKLQESARMEQAAKSQAEFVMNMSVNLEQSMKQWFDIVENTIVDIQDESARAMLRTMQDEGMTTRNNIRDAIDYIRMSASKVEIMEANYELSELAGQIKKSIKKIAKDHMVDVDIFLGECTETHLFGDSGRIGQMLNRSMREILDKKKSGRISMELSTKRVSYATVLSIVIRDYNTVYTDSDMEHMRGYFENTEDKNWKEENMTDMWLSLQGILLQKMSGKILVEKQENDMIINIELPQLAI